VDGAALRAARGADLRLYWSIHATAAARRVLADALAASRRWLRAKVRP
jgi:hypothetical protein